MQISTQGDEDIGRANTRMITDIIMPSNSEYANPVVIVRKKMVQVAYVLITDR